jgi:tRNA pseudouridine synthase 10
MEVRDLQYITREQTKNMRDGEVDKTKCYSALCYCYSKLEKQDIEKLNNLDEVKIFQKTPIRVLHRRTVMTRPRIVSEIKAELIDEHHFRIRMKTQAGT